MERGRRLRLLLLRPIVRTLLLEEREISAANAVGFVGLVGAVGIETTSLLEIKEFCGAARPSK